jgi:hypothetical protein
MARPARVRRSKGRTRGRGARSLPARTGVQARVRIRECAHPTHTRVKGAPTPTHVCSRSARPSGIHRGRISCTRRHTCAHTRRHVARPDARIPASVPPADQSRRMRTRKALHMRTLARRRVASPRRPMGSRDRRTCPHAAGRSVPRPERASRGHSGSRPCTHTAGRGRIYAPPRKDPRGRSAAEARPRQKIFLDFFCD